jgi:hypothetical protein
MVFCKARFSVSAEQRPGFEPSFPVIISDDVIVSANGGELPSFEDLADATASCNGLASGTKRVILHALAIKKDVVADQEHILENVEGEAGRVAIDVEDLDAVMDEVLIEGGIEGEGAADLVDRIVGVDAYLGSEEFPVKIRSTKEVVMSE